MARVQLIIHGVPKPVDAHAEALGPERLLNRHHHRSALGERAEDSLGPRSIVDVDRDLEALRLFIRS